MYLLVSVLEQTEHLPAILEGFAKIGVTGTTIFNSSGMGRVLMKSGAELPAKQENLLMKEESNERSKR